jgi:hypothetical protein
LLFGKLNLPLEALRVIEDGSSTPEEMQKNMGFIDECGNPSSAIMLTFIKFGSKTQSFPTASSADACAAAAEIYDCGKKKAPDMTSAIQENARNRAAAAVGVRQTIFVLNALFLLK